MRIHDHNKLTCYFDWFTNVVPKDKKYWQLNIVFRSNFYAIIARNFDSLCKTLSELSNLTNEGTNDWIPFVFLSFGQT